MNPNDPNQRRRPVTVVQPLSALEPHEQDVVVPPGTPPNRMTRKPQPKRYRAWLKPTLLGVGAVLVLALVTTTVVVLLSGKDKPESTVQRNTSDTPAQATPPAPTTIRLLASGDFIAHDSVNSAAQKADDSYDYMPLMSDFSAVFKKSDIRFCNDPILNGGKQFGIIGYPTFNSPTEFVRDMGKLGCNLVATASNHSFDKTQDVVSASVQTWSATPNMLAVVGQSRNQPEHDKISYFTVKGVKFAFLAYTTYTNKPVQNAFGVNMFSKEFAGNQIKEAQQNGAQIIIASMRWGTEYSAEVNEAQQSNAQFLADQGVNLILGHGPHVLQSTEELTGSSGNKTLVWYSLGNFINTQIPAETVFNGLGVMDLDIKTKQITTHKFLPIYMHYEWSAEEVKAETLTARHNLHLYLLENANQGMIDSQQLKTTIEAQKKRMHDTLNANGLEIPLITSKDL